MKMVVGSFVELKLGSVFSRPFPKVIQSIIILKFHPFKKWIEKCQEFIKYSYH
jgi:hypothetical protein